MAEVDEQWAWIWRAWHRMSIDRPYYGGGMDRPVPGRIPWTMVMQWAREYRLADGERDLLDYCIVRMDVVFADWYNASKENA